MNEPIRELIEFDEDPIKMVDCYSCNGMGMFSIGDVEDGVDEICTVCEGSGLLDYEEGERDEFIPERDALTPND